MFLKLSILLIITTIIIYLIIILKKSHDKNANTDTPLMEKKVRFFGVPSEIDNIKPVFKPSSFTSSHKTYRFNPVNNIEAYENNAI
tara:strand:+ start:1273 stop:1530 length:258 start_codon:yes stop_codon:yes gene_type:complete